jgi:hypothetical protein
MHHGKSWFTEFSRNRIRWWGKGIVCESTPYLSPFEEYLPLPLLVKRCRIGIRVGNAAPAQHEPRPAAPPVPGATSLERRRLVM